MYSQEPKEGYSITRSTTTPRIPGFGSAIEDKGSFLVYAFLSDTESG
jgi:hypothetical protein